MKIRKATIHEADLVSDLCFRSKAHWGYSEEFMEACRDDLTIAANYIETSLVYVIEEDDSIKGFMGLERGEDHILLGYFFIDPDAIGKGYGKALWEHMIQVVKSLNMRTVLIHSDPYAEEFYLARGAVRIGEIESTVIPDRKLPLLRFELRG
ncbi:GNAT family N-acetyltransferase [Brevibacillus reuszeri]|uniref:GNAT family N-acetyltransferase n=1 Tax=Brevibacillus reuszeri TaxID=54915 RepID=UPI0013E09164|nr:GNAT family N-acetyltransferase [Brevibacillus reuszeri]